MAATPERPGPMPHTEGLPEALTTPGTFAPESKVFHGGGVIMITRHDIPNTTDYFTQERISPLVSLTAAAFQAVRPGAVEDLGSTSIIR